MPEWDVYLCRINDTPSVVALDLELAREAPQEERPQCLWATVRLRQRCPDGWGTNAETEVLYRVEDAIVRQVEALGALYVGRIRGGGRWELCFYAPATAAFESAVESAMGAFPAYEWRCDDEHDPQWKFYLDVLYPDAVSYQQILNARVLQQLRDSGDDLTRPREVNHWIYFAEESDRDAFAREAATDGYAAHLIAAQEKPSDRPYGVRLSRTDHVSPNSIDNAVIALCEMANRHNGDYDGWETAVVK